MIGRRLLSVVISIPMSCMLWADCPANHDHRDDKKSGVLIMDFVISGTQTLSTDELSEIESKITGSCFNEDSDELGERIRALFQDRGYFMVEVKNVRLRSTDVLGVPESVTLEADVTEGGLFRLAQVKIVGNHAFSAEKLRSQFPMKSGALFARSKVAGGLSSLSKLYAEDGFLDWTTIPETQVSSNGTVILTLTVSEGQQYRMGQLQILAKKEIADKLRGDWHLEEGSVFDVGYIDRYIDVNREKLPSGFNREDVQLVRDCPKGSVDVRLLIDPIYAAQQPSPKEVTCEQQRSSN